MVQVRGDSVHTETIDISGKSAVPDDVAAGLLAGPLAADAGGGAGLQSLMAEAVNPGALQSERAKKPKPSRSLHAGCGQPPAVREFACRLARVSMWPPPLVLGLAVPARKLAPPPLPADASLLAEGTTAAQKCLTQAAEADSLGCAISEAGYSETLQQDLAEHARSLRRAYSKLLSLVRVPTCVCPA